MSLACIDKCVDKPLTAADCAAILRDVFRDNAAKKIAREFSVSLASARYWLAGSFPLARTRQLVIAVDAEIARIDARLTEIRQQLGLDRRVTSSEQRGRDAAQSTETVGRDAGGVLREDSPVAGERRGTVK